MVHKKRLARLRKILLQRHAKQNCVLFSRHHIRQSRYLSWYRNYATEELICRFREGQEKLSFVARSALDSMDFTEYTRLFFTGVRRPKRVTDRSPPAKAEFKNEWTQTAIPPPYAFITWRRIFFLTFTDVGPHMCIIVGLNVGRERLYCLNTVCFSAPELYRLATTASTHNRPRGPPSLL